MRQHLPTDESVCFHILYSRHMDHLKMNLHSYAIFPKQQNGIKWDGAGVGCFDKALCIPPSMEHTAPQQPPSPSLFPFADCQLWQMGFKPDGAARGALPRLCTFFC